MSRILRFDPFNGVSGDMILGALIHLGLPVQELKEELGKLKLAEYELEVEEIVRKGIQGINFRVRQGKSTSHHHSRGFREIKSLIDESELDSWVKEKAGAIFRRLGEAEAKVHKTSLQEVHFHEVGAVDAIVDIVGACIGCHYFGVELFESAPLNLGSGTVTFSHGTWPVPAPATAELVTDFPVFMDQVQGELTTPTGAAIVTTLVKERTGSAVYKYERWGFGAGDREFEEIPNMLRLVLGTRLPEHEGASAGPHEAWHEEEICLMEANIDDMDGEMVGHFLELALKKKALDAYCTPVQMKKSRPGIKLSVLCRPVDRERMAELIFRETTTLGVRWSLDQRWLLSREVKWLETDYGKIAIKIARHKGEIVNVTPEYEDLKAMAERTNIPLKTLRQHIMGQIIDQGYE